jgi:hypothetical protein
VRLNSKAGAIGCIKVIDNIRARRSSLEGENNLCRLFYNSGVFDPYRSAVRQDFEDVIFPLHVLTSGNYRVPRREVPERGKRKPTTRPTSACEESVFLVTEHVKSIDSWVGFATSSLNPKV